MFLLLIPFAYNSLSPDQNGRQQRGFFLGKRFVMKKIVDKILIVLAKILMPVLVVLLALITLNTQENLIICGFIAIFWFFYYILAYVLVVFVFGTLIVKSRENKDNNTHNTPPSNKKKKKHLLNFFAKIGSLMSSFFQIIVKNFMDIAGIFLSVVLMACMVYVIIANFNPVVINKQFMVVVFVVFLITSALGFVLIAKDHCRSFPKSKKSKPVNQ